MVEPPETAPPAVLLFQPGAVQLECVLLQAPATRLPARCPARSERVRRPVPGTDDGGRPAQEDHRVDAD